MTLDEMLSSLHALSRVDKLRVIQIMAADVARDEGVELAVGNTAYPVWSPYNAFEGAAALLQVLNEEPNA